MQSALFLLFLGPASFGKYAPLHSLTDDLDIFIHDTMPPDWMGPSSTLLVPKAHKNDLDGLWQTQMRPFDEESGEPDYSRRMYIHRTKEAMMQYLVALLNGAIAVESIAYLPYIAARYSLMDNGHEANTIIRELLRVVPVEEMLHIALVGNILTALGEEVLLFTGKQTAGYYNFPIRHMFGDLTNNERHYRILPADRVALNSFFVFETGNVQMPLEWQGNPCGYGTISEFYQDVERLIIALETEANEAGESIFLSVNATRQMGLQLDRYYFREPGIVIIRDLNDALYALNIITWQGEGNGDPIPGNDEPTHAEVFAEVLRVFDGKNGTQTYPRIDERASSIFHELQWRDALTAFYAGYSYQMLLVERLYQIDSNVDAGGKQAVAFQGMGPMMGPFMREFMTYMIQHSAYPLMSGAHYQFNDDTRFPPKAQLVELIENARRSAQQAGNAEGVQFLQRVLTTMMFVVDIPLHLEASPMAVGDI